MEKRPVKKKNNNVDYWKEFIYTFSNNKSLFSSKKIERFVVFNTFLILTIIYVIKNIDTMDSMSFIEIIGVWLFYGGYNSMMNLKDRKLTNEVSEGDIDVPEEDEQ